jgi:hypothetical protein
VPSVPTTWKSVPPQQPPMQQQGPLIEPISSPPKMVKDIFKILLTAEILHHVTLFVVHIQFWS